MFLNQPGGEHPAGEAVKRLVLIAGIRQTDLSFVPVTGSPTRVELFFLTDQFHEIQCFVFCLRCVCIGVVCRFRSTSSRYRTAKKKSSDTNPAHQQ